MKQKRLGDILYVYSLEPYVITEDTDASLIYVQTEYFDAYKALNPSLTQLAKKNYKTLSVWTPEWIKYQDLPDEETYAISINNSITNITGTTINGTTKTIETDTGVNNLLVFVTDPKLINPGYPPTYDSSDREVADISNDGEVTINGVGSTLLTATYGGDETFDDQTEEWRLTVKNGDNSRVNPDLAFDKFKVTTYYNEEIPYPVLSNPYNVSVVYSLSGTEYATIDSHTGQITILTRPIYGWYELNIFATFSGNEFYSPQQVRYILEVYPERASIDGFRWSQEEFIATIGEENNYPDIIGPSGVNYSVISYSSSDNTKAIVHNEDYIELLAPTGNGYITVSANIQPEGYKPVIISYRLIIRENTSQTTLDVDYYSSDGKIQVYGDKIEPTPSVQTTLDVDYTSNTGAIQVYGQLSQIIVEDNLEVDYQSNSENVKIYN